MLAEQKNTRSIQLFLLDSAFHENHGEEYDHELDWATTIVVCGDVSHRYVSRISEFIFLHIQS